MLIIIKTVVKIVWIGISVVMLVMGAGIIRVNTQGTNKAAGLYPFVDSGMHLYAYSWVKRK